MWIGTKRSKNKKEIKRTNNHIERCLTPPAIKEMTSNGVFYLSAFEHQKN